MAQIEARTHKSVRITPEAKVKLIEMAAAEQRKPTYQLSLIVEETYKIWKATQQ